LTNAEPVVREPELSLQHYGENVYSVDWNAENNLILSGDVAGTISIWNATTGEILQTLDIDCPVYSVAWSPDGTRFAYANADGEIEIVNIDIEAMPTPTADS
jgi:WD40 repeat protein